MEKALKKATDQPDRAAVWDAAETRTWWPVMITVCITEANQGGGVLEHHGSGIEENEKKKKKKKNTAE
jgi:hypothetical protein